MKATWFTDFVLLFRPEDSSRLADGKHLIGSSYQSVDEKSHVSTNAIVWTLISVVAGLCIGQF